MPGLLERDDLLAQLTAAHSAGGRLVFVGGEAGVGKTSLVAAFTAGLEAVLRGACENLTTPTPLGPFLDVGDVAAAGEPRLVANALLEELRPGMVVVLEDLHWADQATLDVLRVLGRRVDRTEALVLATYRDDEVGEEHPLRVVLGELASARSVSRLTVPRLSLEAVRELAGPHGADGDAIHRITDGNAFYVTEVLATGGELPATVRDAVLARAAGFDRDARALLDVVALVPARAELWLLEAVAGPLDALDACLASGMLRADGDAVAFRHELARLALESAVPAIRRRDLHAEILRALETPPDGAPDFARLAHHAELAGDAEAVLEYALDAARAAEAASAFREAAAQYGRALRHGERLAPADRLELLGAYATYAHIVGAFDEAIAARLEAIELARRLGDVLAEGETLARLPGVYIADSRNAEAEEASRAAIAVLETLPPGRELALAYAFQGFLRMIARDNADGVTWGERGHALAVELDDADLIAYTLNVMGISRVMAGELEEGVRQLRESLAVAEEHDLHLRVGSAHSMLASGLGEMYDLVRAEESAHRYLAHADEHGADPTYIHAWLACLRVYRGDWDGGTAIARRVLRQGRGAIGRITALIAIGRVRARRGDPGTLDVFEEALALTGPNPHLQRTGHLYAARAEAAWLAGDRDRAVHEARAVYDVALEKRHLWFAGELAYWRSKAGDLDEPPDWIAEPYRLQLAGRAREAADSWLARDAPYEAARALSEGDADAQLEALSAFESLGARPAAKLLRQALRAQGVSAPRGPRPATRATPGELTARELEVLRLVAAGKRNADVADALVLSRRTVDHHVSAILRKLGVANRGEAAAAASKLGLLEDR